MTELRKTVDIKTVDEDARTATGAVLVPDELDHQQDFLRADAVQNFQADDVETGVMHSAFPDDAAALERNEVISEAEAIGGETFPPGTWVATRRYKDDAGAYVTVPGATSTNVAIRWTMGDNSATYDGKKDTQTELSANLTLDTGKGDKIAVAWFNDGAIVAGTATRFITQGSGFSVGTPTTSLGICPDCVTGSTYDIRVANLDSTDDIDVGELNGLLEADV